MLHIHNTQWVARLLATACALLVLPILGISQVRAGDEIAASHILIEYAGSERAKPGISRTREEALELANKIAGRAQAGEDFAELAKKLSEGPSASNGGSLGTFRPQMMVPELSAATLELAVGGISKPVETRFGFHVIRRDEVVPKEVVGARHILIMHTGSQRKPATVTRTPEEARKFCEEILAKVHGGEDFAKLAGLHSDGPSKSRGGDLGEFARGAMVKAFDEAAFGLKVGKVSEVVETPFGFHIIQRYK